MKEIAKDRKVTHHFYDFQVKLKIKGQIGLLCKHKVCFLELEVLM